MIEIFKTDRKMVFSLVRGTHYSKQQVQLLTLYKTYFWIVPFTSYTRRCTFTPSYKSEEPEVVVLIETLLCVEDLIFGAGDDAYVGF